MFLTGEQDHLQLSCGDIKQVPCGKGVGEDSTTVVREGLIRGKLGQIAMKLVKKDLWSTDYREPINLVQ